MNSKDTEILIENSNDSAEKSMNPNSKEKIEFPIISGFLKNSPKSSIFHKPNLLSILKNRVMSPIFLTDSKNISTIENNNEDSILNPYLKKSSLYEALNKDYEKKWQKEEEKMWLLKKKNKRVNKELRQKLDKMMQELDESKTYEEEERGEITKKMGKMKEKWEEISDKTKEIDALRLMTRDSKEKEGGKVGGVKGGGMLRKKRK